MTEQLNWSNYLTATLAIASIVLSLVNIGWIVVWRLKEYFRVRQIRRSFREANPAYVAYPPAYISVEIEGISEVEEEIEKPTTRKLRT